jgi:phi13 family phage major tail protein
MAGVKIGVKNFHYAKLTSDSESGVKYESPVKVPGLVTININPNPSVETLFADDAPFETAATTGQITAEISLADLPLDVQADLLGHTLDANGQLKVKADDTPPYVAIGFESLKSNGSKRYVWLVKGKFSEPEDNNETKGDSINFQSATITASFVSREYDGIWKIVGDEDATGWSEPTKGWYDVSVLGDVTA